MMKARLAALALTASATFAAALFFGRDSGANLPKEVGARTMPAVAFLVAADLQDGKLVPIASGSGSILTADGSVLTNRHVVWDETNHRYHDVVAIGLLK